MISYEIHSATIADVRAVAGALRAGDRAELDAIGPIPFKTVWRSWRRSYECHAGYVDGNPAAIWGCSGALLGETGKPWLLTTPAVERIPLSFVREARRGVARMLQRHRRLIGYVDARYLRAQGFLELLGFEIGTVAIEIGPQKVPFLPYTMEGRS